MKSVRYSEVSQNEVDPISSSQYGAITSPPRRVPSQPFSYCGFTVILACVFLCDMARGMLFPTMWMYVQSLGGSMVTQGMAVGAFSMGRILSSPILGSLSDIFGYKKILLLSCLIVMIGCLQYALAETVDTLLTAQLLIGIGSATLPVTRSYVADTSNKEQRSALMSCVQYAAFAVTPFFGSAASYYGLHHTSSFYSLPINEYSAPAIVTMLFSIVCLLLLLGMPAAAVSTMDRSAATQRVHADSNSVFFDYSRHQWQKYVIIAGCILNSILKGCMGIFETIGAEFALSQLDLSAMTLGYVFTLFGAAGVLTLIAYPYLLTRCSEIAVLLCGMACMLLASVLLVLWAGLPVFVIAIILIYSIGYPLAHTANLCLFSKVKNGPQSFLLSWFGVFGSLGRILFPIASGIFAEHFGDQVVFGSIAVMLGVALIAVFTWRGIINSICLSSDRC